MPYSSNEVKSGIFISVCVILLFVLTFIVGRMMSGETQTYQIRFGYINGLKKNAPVYFSGHEVGKVNAIHVTSEVSSRPILVTVQILKSIALRQDSRAFIDTLGLLGEKFVELSPGTPDAPALPADGILEGEDPIAMHVLIGKLNLLADRMDTLTVSLNPFMVRLDALTANNKDRLQAIVENLDASLAGVKTMTADNQEEIAKTIANLHEVSANLRDMTQDLKFRPWRLLRKD